MKETNRPAEHVTVDDLAELQTLMLAQQARLDTERERVDELAEALRMATLCLLGALEGIRPESSSGGL